MCAAAETHLAITLGTHYKVCLPAGFVLQTVASDRKFLLVASSFKFEHGIECCVACDGDKSVWSKW
jgi:hypothetical protein